MRKIKKDDMEIYSIGVDNLQFEDLVHSCRARGIRTDSKTGSDMDRSEQMESYLRQQLSAWIHLSLRENLSNSLLLMLQVFNITQVAQVGQEVGKDMTADIQQEIDREREEELIKEELEDEEKEREQKRLLALATAMKAEAALRGSQRHVKEVKEELSEVKEDLVDTVSRLKEITETMKMGPAQDHDKNIVTSAERLERRLGRMTVGLEKAMEHLPASLAQQEEQDRKAKAAAKDAEVAELAVVEAQKARAQQLKQEAEKDWEHARRSSLQDVSALPASTLAAFADNDAQPPKTASDLDNEKSHDSPAERTSKPQGEREQQQQPPAESPRAAPVQSVQSPAPVEPEEVKEVAAANGK
jgi:hypothetical protein